MGFTFERGQKSQASCAQFGAGGGCRLSLLPERMGYMARHCQEDGRERLFAYLYDELCNPREAAVRAGYPAQEAEAAAASLLSQTKVRRRLGKNRRRLSGAEVSELALRGLIRLAFGSANDAARLALCEGEISAGELAGLDLFSVSEIRRPKGGGCEVRLFDRLRALELLLAQAGGREENSGVNGLYHALKESMRGLASEEADAD